MIGSAFLIPALGIRSVLALILRVTGLHSRVVDPKGLSSLGTLPATRAQTQTKPVRAVVTLMAEFACQMDCASSL